MPTDSQPIEEKNKIGFKKGNRFGKTVKTPMPTGYQTFKARLTWWMESKSVSQIEALIKNKKAWNKLPAIDAMVAMRVSESYERGGGASMMIILDRLLGKPNQSLTGIDETPLVPKHSMDELARRTAFLLALASHQPAQSAPLTLESAKIPDSVLPPSKK